LWVGRAIHGLSLDFACPGRSSAGKRFIDDCMTFFYQSDTSGGFVQADSVACDSDRFSSQPDRLMPLVKNVERSKFQEQAIASFSGFTLSIFRKHA